MTTSRDRAAGGSVLQLIRERWRTVAASGPVGIAAGVLWLWDWGGRFDLLYNHGGSVLSFLLNPPTWVLWLTLVVGIICIAWDSRRAQARGEGALAKSGNQVLLETAATAIPAVMVGAFLVFAVVFLSTRAPSLTVGPPALPSVPVATPTPTAPTSPARPSESELVNFNFEKLMVSLDALNGIQAQRVKDSYIGKWMKMEGPLGRVSPSSTAIFLSFAVPLENAGRVICRFALSDSAQLEHLSANDHVAVIGRIYDFYPSGLDMTDCQLERGKP